MRETPVVDSEDYRQSMRCFYHNR